MTPRCLQAVRADFRFNLHGLIWSNVAPLAGNYMTSDQDKLVRAATQELHRLHSGLSDLASGVLILLRIGAIVIGVFLATWIFRRGLSRS